MKKKRGDAGQSYQGRMQGWTVCEIVFVDESERIVERPFSMDLFCGKGDPITKPIQKMRLLMALGPEARKTLEIERPDTREPNVHILKCKTGCWRLYYHVQGTERRFVFLRAACKLKWDRNPQDTETARSRLERSNARIAEFVFPA